MMEQTKAQPLKGLRVLELARVLAGPWAGQLLADLGADVIKIESPQGDETRSWGPPYWPTVGDNAPVAAYYHAANRGKRSVVADFGTEDGRDLVKRLAADADVVLENFKVGGLAKFGLDHECLKAINPDLITCSITGFGQDGPYAHRAGYDFIIQGMSGMMDITGEPDRPPQKMGMAMADILTGLYGVIGVLAALRERDRLPQQEQAQHVDMALLDCMTATLANQAQNYLASGKPPKRVGSRHPNIVPYQVVPVRDGNIIIACGNNRQFARLVDVLGKPELSEQPQFATNAARVANRDDLTVLLESMTVTWPRDQLLVALEDKGVPAGPINTVEQALGDTQIRHRGMVIDAEREDGSHIKALRSPIVINGLPATAAHAGPELGADGQDIQWRD